MSKKVFIFESWADDILAYALENWDSDGWDYIYECYSVDDIIDMISSCHDFDEALSLVAATALAYAEARDEAEATIV